MVQPGHSLAGHVPDAWGTFSPDIIECTGAITKSICANVLLVAGGCSITLDVVGKMQFYRMMLSPGIRKSHIQAKTRQTELLGRWNRPSISGDL